MGDPTESGVIDRDVDAPTSIDGVLTVSEAATLLRIGRNKLYELVSRNLVPHRRLGRAIRLSRSALLAWLAHEEHANLGPWSSRSQKGPP